VNDVCLRPLGVTKTVAVRKLVSYHIYKLLEQMAYHIVAIAEDHTLTQVNEGRLRT
jgi:hypothetical protein